MLHAPPTPAPGSTPNPHAAFDLTDDVVLVTGASRGLGRSMALGLARAGAQVIAVARDGAALAATASEAGPGRIDAFTCDVTDRAEVTALVADVLDRHGRIDVLVNNAGVANEGPFATLPPAQMAQTIDVNLVGVLHVTQVVGLSMIERGGGRIVNIGSVDGVVGTPGLAVYCATKGAVVQLTRALAAEWARHGVRVNCLCPGYFRTSINEATLDDEVLGPRILRRIPARRFGEPDELVPSVLYLASRASDFMTGHSLVIDGGESAR